MKKICALIMVLIMMLSTTVCYGSDKTEYIDRSIYLKDMGVLTGNIDGGVSRVDMVNRIVAATVIARVMTATDPNWTITDKHTFKDVPAWANKVVGIVECNGIMKGYDDKKFGSIDPITVRDFTTVLLRAMGYGYNSEIQEFTWNDSVKTALEVGLINDSEYNTIQNEDRLTRGTMVLLAYNAVKMCNNDPYTDEYLNELIEKNLPSAEIKAFRNNDDPTRKGYTRAPFMYIDIFYHDTPEAKACIKLLTPHVNKVYAMLQNLYGIQPAFDVYLIDEKDVEAPTPSQYPVVKNDKMTYVVLAKAQDADGNNLGELVREMNNVFYDNLISASDNKMMYTAADLPWKARANMGLIGSLYTKFNYSGKVDQASMFELPSMRIQLRVADKAGMSKYDKNKLYEFYYYSKMFSFEKTSEFKGCLKILGREKTMAPPSMPATMLLLDKSFIK